MKGKLIVISGPSGVGKDTLVAQLFVKVPRLIESVSATTRKPRPGEENGVNYFFVTKGQFQDMIDKGELLEWNEYAGNFYGTPKKFVKQHLDKGQTVLLSIDINGAKNAKKSFPHAHLVFIAPPSLEELRNRLVERQTETPEQIEKRLQTAKVEMQEKEKYDHVVVNDDLSVAVEELAEYINQLQ